MVRYTYRVDLAYDGSAFAGFARQRDQRTVEGQLVAAWQPLVKRWRGLQCGGRTDRGVHALRQTVSFWLHERLALAHIEQAADDALGGDGWVLSCREVERSFHAKFSARARHYFYLLGAPPEEGPGVPDDLALGRLDGMLAALTGERHMSAFARKTPPEAKPVRHILFAGASRRLAGGVRIDVVARGFLRKQVRVMVSTALRETAAGADVQALVRLAETADRQATARPADPNGLYLAQIIYPEA